MPAATEAHAATVGIVALHSFCFHSALRVGCMMTAPLQETYRLAELKCAGTGLRLTSKPGEPSRPEQQESSMTVAHSMDIGLCFAKDEGFSPLGARSTCREYGLLGANIWASLGFAPLDAAPSASVPSVRIAVGICKPEGTAQGVLSVPLHRELVNKRIQFGAEAIDKLEEVYFACSGWPAIITRVSVVTLVILGEQVPETVLWLHHNKHCELCELPEARTSTPPRPGRIGPGMRGGT